MHLGKKGRAIALAGVAVGALAFAPLASKAATISGWDFENYPGSDTLINNPLSDIGPVTGTGGSLGMTNSYNSTTSTTTDDVIPGVSGDTGTNGFADTTQIFRVRGQNPGNGWSSQAPVGSQGATFAASTAGYSGITVAFDWYSTKRGEANMQLEYTTDGVNYTNIPITVPAADLGSVSIVNNNPSTDSNSVTGSYLHIIANSGGQQWIPGLTATINDPAAANDPNFGIALVSASTGASDVDATGAALNNSSGNWRFDNVSINGAPVPEPATLGLVGLAGLGLLSRRRSSAK
jgi:hypothetical protein